MPTRKLSYFAIATLFAVAITFASENRALAYVDPGSGLLILQNVGAVITGTLFFFRRRIKALFTRKPKKDKELPPETPPPS